MWNKKINNYGTDTSLFECFLPTGWKKDKNIVHVMLIKCNLQSGGACGMGPVGLASMGVCNLIPCHLVGPCYYFRLCHNHGTSGWAKIKKIKMIWLQNLSSHRGACILLNGWVVHACPRLTNQKDSKVQPMKYCSWSMRRHCEIIHQSESVYKYDVSLSL